MSTPAKVNPEYISFADNSEDNSEHSLQTLSRMAFINNIFGHLVVAESRAVAYRCKIQVNNQISN